MCAGTLYKVLSVHIVSLYSPDSILRDLGTLESSQFVAEYHPTFSICKNGVSESSESCRVESSPSRVSMILDFCNFRHRAPKYVNFCYCAPKYSVFFRRTDG